MTRDADDRGQRAALEVPSTADELSPAWLTRALRIGGAIDRGEVVSASATTIGQELGFTGVVARLELAYSVDGTGPRSIVAKLPMAERAVESGFRRRLAADPLARRRLGVRSRLEVRFYRELAPLAPAPVARLLYGASDPRSGRAVLLLEDLGRARQPDLIAGMSPADVRAVLRVMAPFHAHWWAAVDTATGWVPPWEPEPDARRERLDRAADTFLDRYATALPDGLPALVAGLRAGYADQLRVLAAGPSTLIHGDLHADNILLAEDAGVGRAVVLDWQTVARGPVAADLNTLLVGSMSPPTRRLHEGHLLGEYQDLLAARGVPADDLAQLVRDYRLASMWHLARTVIWLSDTDPRSLAGRERLIMEAMVTEPRVFLAALEHA